MKFIPMGGSLMLAEGHINRVTGGWEVPGTPTVFPSLISAYGSKFAGHMRIQDMATHFAKDGLSLQDFAEDNLAATVELIRVRWMQAYLHGQSITLRLQGPAEEYVKNAIAALDTLMTQLKEKNESLDPLWGALREARAQFELLLKFKRPMVSGLTGSVTP